MDECCQRTFEGHTGSITSVSISGDGHWIVSSSEDKTIRIWDATTGHCMHIVEFPNGSFNWVSAVRLSRDGRWIISGHHDGDVALWETVTGRCICSFDGDAETQSADLDNDIIRTYTGHTGEITSLSISDDGHWIASGSQDGTVKLWDTLAECHQRTFEGHTGNITSVSISGDGRWIVSGSQDHTVRIWEAVTGRCVHILQGHTAEITAVCISENGHWVVSGSKDTTVQYWDTVTGCRIQRFRTFSDEAETVCLSDDGDWIIATFRNATVQRWTTKPFHYPACSLAPSRVLSFIDVTHTNTVARTLLQHVSHALKTQQFAQALDILTRLRSQPGWERHAQSMDAWARLARHCSRSHPRAAWHIKTVAIVPLEIVGSCPVSIDLNGNWAASSDSKKVIWLWNIKNGQSLQRFQGHRERVAVICISDDGRFLFSGSVDATIRLWETATGHCLQIFQVHTGTVTSVSISGDGYWIASGSADGTIRLWETATGRCLRIFEDHIKGLINS
ncbi:MAG: WD40 repeat domain-containing protein [Ktedonobacteraceae bacterium]|nr:WD40 repeat domain-containing protein [Ktedonobacteraceae bacterium]